MQISIINNSNNPNPKYQTKSSAGMDLMAFVDDPIIIESGQWKLISTGIYIKLPTGFEAQVRPRSGLALKKGITVLNSPGTIDSDYRGEIGVILINHSKNNFIVNSGDRIAQLVIAKHESINLKNVQSIDSSNRGTGGFGSTGTN
ncbi:MAG: dUTP diphosphatase [Flavobacteriaceae bacterium]|tara:strand:- start:532 stop:966 length:435 start_codon:yes stop_codon:yes gene_type:complete